MLNQYPWRVLLDSIYPLESCSRIMYLFWKYKSFISINFADMCWLAFGTDHRLESCLVQLENENPRVCNRSIFFLQFLTVLSGQFAHYWSFFTSRLGHGHEEGSLVVVLGTFWSQTTLTTSAILTTSTTRTTSTNLITQTTSNHPAHLSHLNHSTFHPNLPSASLGTHFALQFKHG